MVIFWDLNDEYIALSLGPALVLWLKYCLTDLNIPELQGILKSWFQDLIDMTLRKLDIDKDGKVSLADWSSTVRKEPLMMEAFGPCLPSKRTIDIFMKKIEAENT